MRKSFPDQFGSGDGCQYTFTIESNYICTGGKTSRKLESSIRQLRYYNFRSKHKTYNIRMPSISNEFREHGFQRTVSLGQYMYSLKFIQPRYI